MGKKLSVAPKKPAKRRSAVKTKRRRVPGRYYAFGVVVLAAFLRLFVLQGYRVPSRAMEDTLLLGDCLLIEKLSYGASFPLGNIRLPGVASPEVGDIAVFRLPEEPDRVYVKRCLAVAGQVVEIDDKVVYVDGVRMADPAFSKYIDARIFSAERSGRDNFGPVEVPPNHVFLVGDNRDNSRDSRHWGFVPVSSLVGRAMCVYWSVEARGDLSGSWLSSVASLPERVRWQRLGEWVR